MSAVYNAVGLAAYELFDNVDFDQWFKNQLLGELQVSHHRYCVRIISFDALDMFISSPSVMIFQIIQHRDVHKLKNPKLFTTRQNTNSQWVK